MVGGDPVQEWPAEDSTDTLAQPQHTTNPQADASRVIEQLAQDQGGGDAQGIVEASPETDTSAANSVAQATQGSKV